MDSMGLVLVKRASQPVAHTETTTLNISYSPSQRLAAASGQRTSS
jgi:hypothetical protein